MFTLLKTRFSAEGGRGKTRWYDFGRTYNKRKEFLGALVSLSK
jgi:hypothetical protein